MKNIPSGIGMLAHCRNRAKSVPDTREIFPGEIVPYSNIKHFLYDLLITI